MQFRSSPFFSSGRPSSVRQELVFWLTASVPSFVYAGYPLLLLLLRIFIRRPIRKRPIQPSVSFLVPAHNEAGVIEAKILNTLSLDYPKDRMEIVIASDGCTDGTEQIIGRFADGERVRIFPYPKKRGKLAVLNDTLPYLRGEIVAFSDASTVLAPDVISRLVESFADPTVGAVSGMYCVTRPQQAVLGASEDLYWRYETFLKKQEAALGSIVGAHGALYAIRKRLFPLLTPSTINDDFVIPIRIVQQGYRVAYEPDAMAFEDARQMSGFIRRARIMAGNVEQLRELKALLRPPRPLALFFFLSHKAGRLAAPFALLGLFVSNLFLARVRFYQWTLSLQLLFYALVPLGAAYPLRPRLLRLPYYFCMANAAVFVGACHALRGWRDVAWKQP